MTLNKIRKLIPEFECIPGCTDCCGVVPWSKQEWDIIQNKKVQHGLTCPYANKETGCEVYEDRPILCRLFGTVKKMRCPHGCGPDEMLSRHDEKKIMKSYYKIMAKE